MQKMSLRIRSLIAGFARNDRGSAAVEFAVIVPIMLTLFFGVVEFSSGIAVDRKVTLVARTMSDLTSQSTTVTDTDLANFTTTGKAIMTPYDRVAAERDGVGIVHRTQHARRQGQVEQGIGAARLRFHRFHSDRAQDRRHLPDLCRGQLQIHADDRLRHGQGRHHAQRFHLHPAAAIVLRAVQPDRPARPEPRRQSRNNEQRQRQKRPRYPHGLSSHSVEFREKLAAELRQPAARRLSAEDLPERRSATIS